MLSQHFGLRGRQEHHDMKIEHFIFKKDEGKEFVTYSEGITKTRPSGLREHHRLVIPKTFQNSENINRCPVNIFKTYLQRHPLELQETGPFYLGIIVNPLTNIWFKKTPMGKNKLDTIMKTMIANST